MAATFHVHVRSDSTKSGRQEVFSKLFNVPASEVPLDDFHCSLARNNGVFSGRMFVTSHFACFTTTQLNAYRTMEVIPLRDIIDVEKEHSQVVIPNAINIVTASNAFFFSDFLFRDRAFDLLQEQRKRAIELGGGWVPLPVMSALDSDVLSSVGSSAESEAAYSPLASPREGVEAAEVGKVPRGAVGRGESVEEVSGEGAEADVIDEVTAAVQDLSVPDDEAALAELCPEAQAVPAPGKVGAPRRRSTSPTDIEVASTSPPEKAPLAPHNTHHTATMVTTVAKARKMQDVRVTFGLGDDDELVESYTAALLKTILLQGRLYLCSKHLCFYANIFGFRTVEKVAYNSIVAIHKDTTAGIFPNAIRITTDTGASLFFSSLLSRDKTFLMLDQLWRSVAPARYQHFLVHGSGGTGAAGGDADEGTSTDGGGGDDNGVAGDNGDGVAGGDGAAEDDDGAVGGGEGGGGGGGGGDGVADGGAENGAGGGAPAHPGAGLTLLSKEELRNRDYRYLFSIPDSEVIAEVHECVLRRDVPRVGQCYISQQFLCFYAKVRGYQTWEVIPIRTITALEKHNSMNLIADTIVVRTSAGMFEFSGFNLRDEFFQLITTMWKMEQLNQTTPAPAVPVLVSSKRGPDFGLLCVHNARERKKQQREAKYAKLFKLDEGEPLFTDVSCALQKGILQTGRMFVYHHSIGFYANIFGHITLESIPYRDIVAITPLKTINLFPNAIEVETRDRQFFFTSFLQRDKVYKKLMHLWKSDLSELRLADYDEEGDSPEGSVLDEPTDPLACEADCGVLAFVNPTSGNRKGHRFAKALADDPRVDVFDLTSADRARLAVYRDKTPEQTRVVIAGGDGTVGWALGVMDEAGINHLPVALLPMGTGNDLSRVLGWGIAYNGDHVERALSRIRTAVPQRLDRWQVMVTPLDGEQPTQRHVMTNYFSIGFDAQISLDFHLLREAHPELCKNRALNKQWYAHLGVRNTFTKLHRLKQHIRVEVDGKEVPLPGNVRAFVVVNIKSYASGMNPWGTIGDDKARLGFEEAAMDDGLLEVCGLRNTLHFLSIRMKINKHAKRLAQGREIVIKFIHNYPLAMQCNGESWMQPPCEVRISHFHSTPMLVPSIQRHKHPNAGARSAAE